MRSYKKLLSLTILLTISLAAAQYISVPQYFQEDELSDELAQQPIERSVNYLNVHLPKNDAEREPVVHVKPVYIPVPVQNSNSRPQQYSFAYQPDLISYVSQPQYGKPNQFLYNSVNSVPQKYSYPWLPTPNKEYPNYVAPPQMPALIKNPALQMPQYSNRFNYTNSVLSLLPQLMSGLTFYNTQLPQQQIFGQEDDFSENLEQFRVNKPLTIESSIKPSAIEPHTMTLPESTLFTIEELQKPTNAKQPTQADTSLLNLLQKLRPRLRVQERLGAVYLKDSLLNRK